MDRFWSLLELCPVEKWSSLASDYLEALEAKRGYGPKFVMALRAYHLGDPNVLPLDGTGFETLIRLGLYAHDANINKVRIDIEEKLGGETGIKLIDFHELLRFGAQYGGAEDDAAKRKTIIGWNAWRLLCSVERARITEAWIYEHLVKDKSIAQELWSFFRRVEDLG